MILCVRECQLSCSRKLPLACAPACSRKSEELGSSIVCFFMTLINGINDGVSFVWLIISFIFFGLPACLCLSLSISVYLCLPISVCLSLSIYLCLSVYLSIYICICLSVSVCLPVCLFLFPLLLRCVSGGVRADFEAMGFLLTGGDSLENERAVGVTLADLCPLWNQPG